MVSTMASGPRTFAPFVGSKDIVMMPAVADVAGVNVLTRKILGNAVAAIVGMVTQGGGPLETGDDLIVGMTQMGVTNGLVEAVRLMEKAGHQVISFHSTGAGGPAMEELIGNGTIRAVMDLTLHEIVAEIIPRTFSGGAHNRLEVACRAGIPQVIAPGGIDFTDLLVEDMPLLPNMERRKYIHHNGVTVHIKLLKDEIVQVGSIMVERLNRSLGPVIVLVPLKGFRSAAAAGEPLWDAEVDNALIEILHSRLKPGIKVVDIDANINDPRFSAAAADAMRELLAVSSR
jgi:uncharacterized protein (UPF0261 family)